MIPVVWRKGFGSLKSFILRASDRGGTASRRPQISAPSDFRHLQSGSGCMPQTYSPEQMALGRAPEAPPVQLRPRPNRQARPSSFRPIELSIYQRNSRRISSMLSFLEFPGMAVTPPEPAQLRERLDEDHQLVRHQRANSTVPPFHLPLRPATDSGTSSLQASSDEQEQEHGTPPPVPEKSQARERAYTSPDVESIRARIAQAMAEAERLQQRIDNVIERQSIYSASRPSTAHSMTGAMSELEPMPSIPALPPPAPSFAERLNCEFERPRTTPPKMEVSGPSRPSRHHPDANRNGDDGDYYQVIDDIDSDTPPLSSLPPPPLPMVLRPPPLRKKKSFSRVSNWLFPRDQRQQRERESQGQHSRDISLDSITNLARPVKGTQGFYQCVAPGGQGHDSFDSMATISTWDSEDCPPTLPNASSPVCGGASGPVKVQDLPRLGRVGTFGTG
ncbi:hypothetical protein GMORB2_4115 [Geosmithia morbida]|uniref:Uncharacterized protein n=1 Tax=Geosmithia morbida TaxID=1094350 RepID=A0A9P4Z064_9HYPO|nr:uncharacterized protein GMORB2_4115 [Geosmithia morbida]KAF4125275.1 hypothetical protein GMORB2_4115 [Geosmithia morbida]